MIVAELYAKVGLKGADATLNDLKKIKTALKETESGDKEINLDVKGAERSISAIEALSQSFEQLNKVLTDTDKNFAKLQSTFASFSSGSKRGVVQDVIGTSSPLPLPPSSAEGLEPQGLLSHGVGGNSANVPSKEAQKIAKALAAAQAKSEKIIGGLFSKAPEEFRPTREMPPMRQVLPGGEQLPEEEKLKKTKEDFKGVFNIGLSDKTQKGLQSISDGMKKVSSTSFEAKAAIIGALFALQALLSKSGAGAVQVKGTGALTGVDTKTLQQYQYAGRQVGLTNEEMLGTFESLQSAMAKTFMGKGAPEGWARFAATMGMGSRVDVEKFMKNPELLLQKLQEYSKKEKNIGIRNEVLSSFVPKNVAGALAQNAFTPEVMKKAPVYSDKDLAGLAAANAAWKNLEDSITRAWASLNGQHGGQIMRALQAVLNVTIKIVGAILDVADKFHLFDLLEKSVKPAIALLNMAVQGISDLIAVVSDFAEETKLLEMFDNGLESIKNTVGGVTKYFAELFKGVGAVIAESTAFTQVRNYLNDIIESIKNTIDKIIALGKSVVDVASKFGVFETIAKFIDSFIGGFDNMLSGVMALFDKVTDLFQGGGIQKQAGDFISKLPSMFSGLVGGLFSDGKGDGKVPESALAPSAKKEEPGFLSNLLGGSSPGKDQKEEKQNLSLVPQMPETFDLSKAVTFEPKGFVYAPNLKLITPNSPLLQSASSKEWRPNYRPTASAKTTVNNVNIDQDLNFAHEGKNSKQTGSDVKKAIKDAFNQLNSLNSNG